MHSVSQNSLIVICKHQLIKLEKNRMHVKTLLNCVEKLKSFVYEDIRKIDAKDGPIIEVNVRPRANSSPICSGCGKKRPGYDTLESRRFEFVPL